MRDICIRNEPEKYHDLNTIEAFVRMVCSREHMCEVCLTYARRSGGTRANRIVKKMWPTKIEKLGLFSARRCRAFLPSGTLRADKMFVARPTRLWSTLPFLGRDKERTILPEERS